MVVIKKRERPETVLLFSASERLFSNTIENPDQLLPNENNPFTKYGKLFKKEIKKKIGHLKN